MTHEEFDDLDLPKLPCQMTDKEIIAYLYASRRRLQDWKESMLAVEREWDEQRIAKLLGARPGQSCRKIINERVPVLIDALRKIANEDYRGNRPWSAYKAWDTLKKIGVEP